MAMMQLALGAIDGVAIPRRVQHEFPLGQTQLTPVIGFNLMSQSPAGSSLDFYSTEGGPAQRTGEVVAIPRRVQPRFSQFGPYNFYASKTTYGKSQSPKGSSR